MPSAGAQNAPYFDLTFSQVNCRHPHGLTRRYILMTQRLIAHSDNFNLHKFDGLPSFLSNGYLGVKELGREADHWPPSSAEVKNSWSYISAPPIHLHGMVLS